MADFLNRWAVSMASGGNPLVLPGTSAFPAVASADGKHSIVCLSHQLRVYFLQTRQCVRTVDVDLSAAVAVHLDPGSDNQLVVFTPAQVFYVNWREKVDSPVVARQQLAPPIAGLTDVFRVATDQYLALAADGGVRVHAIDRETAATRELFAAPAAQYAVSRNGQWLAAVGAMEVSLWSLAAAGAVAQPAAAIAATRETFAFAHRAASCVCVADSAVVAVGAATGALHVYHGGAAAKPRTLKWHVDPVQCAAFSADDTYLVSGGNEKVLVFWHLESDQTQFLPRLAGPIERVHVDRNRPDHYSVALRVASGAHRAHELLTVSAVDLVSRLAVSPVCPDFAVPVARAVAVARKRPARAPALDVSAPVAVHPTSRQLYFARGAAVQAYDVVRGEQAFLQHAAPQLSTGRVRSEHAVADPTVRAVAFTEDGRWMATFDSMPTSDFDHLMSRNDTAYALKFWRWDDRWVLASKVVDPHGPALAVGAIAGHADAFTTLDCHGGLRVWRPKLNNAAGSQTVWTLRRASAPAAFAAPVAMCRSADGSLLVASHGACVRMYDPASLSPLPAALPPMDSHVERLALVGSCLVIASQSKVLSYDLIAARETPLVGQLSAPGIGNLLATDPVHELVAVVVNSLATADSKILLFRPNALAPVHTARHSSPIASLAYTPSGFLFVDTDCRIGVLAPELKRAVGDTPEDSLSDQMHHMLVSAQAAANVLYSRAVDENSHDSPADAADKWTTQKTIDVASLQPLFANVDGVSMDSLFERVVRAIQ